VGIENVTWKQLRSRVQRVYDSMLASGVQEGDRVAAVTSNSVDAIAICLAALAIGAIYSSASPDLGTKAIVDRFKQIAPKLIFADNGFLCWQATQSRSTHRGMVTATGQGNTGHRSCGAPLLPYCRQ
jgi:acyl-coenzyme A synthetase/AMP-(fatty) acid ligase